MAITYKWDIKQMDAHIHSEGEDNVIYTVHYAFTGSEMAGSGEMYYAQVIGAEEYKYVAGQPFIPYENTEAFEAVVIGWLQGSLDVSAMQTTIEEGIQAQMTPINEALYFSWQDPAPTPPPVIEPEVVIEDDVED